MTAPAGEDIPRRRPPRGLWRAGAAGGVILLLWLGGLLWFTASMPDAVDDADRRTDAIVVLTGGSERLDAGLALLATGKARKLLISGVDPTIETSELMRVSGLTPDNLHCCVVLGRAANDTAGNALETAAWMADEGFSSLRLVTAVYHMPRSLLEFRRAMPAATIVPHPVFPGSVKHENWWRWPGTTALYVGEYVKFIAAQARGALEDMAGWLTS